MFTAVIAAAWANSVRTRENCIAYCFLGIDARTGAARSHPWASVGSGLLIYHISKAVLLSTVNLSIEKFRKSNSGCRSGSIRAGTPVTIKRYCSDAPFHPWGHGAGSLGTARVPKTTMSLLDCRGYLGSICKFMKTRFPDHGTSRMLVGLEYFQRPGSKTEGTFRACP